jgi:hypothetical protein
MEGYALATSYQKKRKEGQRSLFQYKMSLEGALISNTG